MNDEYQKRILSALLILLRPIARALLKVGVGYREFSETAKMAFVETATKDFGLRGRPTNVSRVAIMTGLTRKEVSRLRSNGELVEATVVRRATPVSEVLHRWHTDKEYLSESGRPLPLEFDGRTVSFTKLVKRYGGDVPPGALKTELKRIDAIEIDNRGLLVPRTRIPYSIDDREKIIGGFVNTIYPAALNLIHNMDSDGEADWWVNLAVTSKYIDASDRGRVMTLSSERLKEFSESLDDLYGAYEALNDRGRDGEGSSKAVGIGVFYFEEDKTETDLFA